MAEHKLMSIVGPWGRIPMLNIGINSHIIAQIDHSIVALGAFFNSLCTECCDEKAFVKRFVMNLFVPGLNNLNLGFVIAEIFQ